MRTLLREMRFSIRARRPTSSISLRQYRVHRTGQRRRKATEAHPRSNPESSPEKAAGDASAEISSSTPPPAGAGPASAGAATAPPLTTKTTTKNLSVWEMVKSTPIGRFGSWYARVQERRPYATQLSSSLVIYLCGDLSAQLLFPAEVKTVETGGDNNSKEGEEESKPRTAAYDPGRTLRHLAVGFGSSIPSYKWFMWLSRQFNYPSKSLSVLTKVIVQQVVYAPIFNIYFFGMHCLLAGATLEETWERLKKAVPVSVKNSVKVWPAVTAFSFMYVPPSFQAVFGGGVAVGWQTYLSWLNQKAAREVAIAEASVEATNHPVLTTESGATSQAALRT